MSDDKINRIYAELLNNGATGGKIIGAGGGGFMTYVPYCNQAKFKNL